MISNHSYRESVKISQEEVAIDSLKLVLRKEILQAAFVAKELSFLGIIIISTVTHNPRLKQINKQKIPQD